MAIKGLQETVAQSEGNRVKREYHQSTEHENDLIFSLQGLPSLEVLSLTARGMRALSSDPLSHMITIDSSPQQELNY
jgi:hypothetical protein